MKATLFCPSLIDMSASFCSVLASPALDASSNSPPKSRGMVETLQGQPKLELGHHQLCKLLPLCVTLEGRWEGGRGEGGGGREEGREERRGGGRGGKRGEREEEGREEGEGRKSRGERAGRREEEEGEGEEGGKGGWRGARREGDSVRKGPVEGWDGRER